MILNFLPLAFNPTGPIDPPSAPVSSLKRSASIGLGSPPVTDANFDSLSSSFPIINTSTGSSPAQYTTDLASFEWSTLRNSASWSIVFTSGVWTSFNGSLTS